MQVYLAGPITGLTYGDAASWRDVASRVLKTHGCIPVSPMRGKEYLAGLGALSGHGREYCELSPLSTPAGVLARDHWDCRRCDIVLVYLVGAKTVSIGTTMEIAWAHAYRKPLVLVMEKEGNPHDHMMITQAADFRVETLDEALLLLRAIKE